MNGEEILFGWYFAFEMYFSEMVSNIIFEAEYMQKIRCHISLHYVYYGLSIILGSF